MELNRSLSKNSAACSLHVGVDSRLTLLALRSVPHIAYRQHTPPLIHPALTGPMSHAFWSTQPTAQGAQPARAGRIHDDVRVFIPTFDEPYSLPAGFEWTTVDVSNEQQLDELHRLLQQHYLGDGATSFRLDYSRDFVRWVLLVPQHMPSLMRGVRASSSKKLVAFIAAVPQHVRVQGDRVAVGEVNFMCIHSKLRSKRLAPVLIKEIVRLGAHAELKQAFYTAGPQLPGRFATSRYHHRHLNIKRLVDARYLQLPKSTTLARYIKLYSVDKTTRLSGWRPMTAVDIDGVCQLLETALAKYDFAVSYSRDDVQHWLLPRPDIVSSYVIVDGGGSTTGSGGQVTHLCSWYSLPSTLTGQSPVRTAYSMYNVSSSSESSGDVLLGDAVVLAAAERFDVFNALDIMDNAKAFQACKFKEGTGVLNYYLYNYTCPELAPQQLAAVMF